jgi:Tol biopolymer transport system component
VYDVLKGTTKQVTFIANQGEYNPSWSPNSKQIAHESVGYNEGTGMWFQQLYITDVETGVSTLVTGGDEANDVAWSPDGKKLMFDYNWSNIYVIPAEGGTPTLLWEGGIMPEWSPDSKQIVFFDWISFSMVTMDLADRTTSTLTYTGQNPDWSPNGQYIAYDDWAFGGIWIIEVNPAGKPVGDPIQLTTTGFQPSWSNNSKTIIYSDIAPDAPAGTWPADIYSVSINGGTPVKVCGFEGADFGDYDPCFSNNGKFIVFAGATAQVQPLAKSIFSKPDPAKVSNSSIQVHVRSDAGIAGFIMNVNSISDERMSVRVIDSQGRLVMRRSGIPANSSINIPNLTAKGTYVAEIRQGNERKIIKLLRP